MFICVLCFSIKKNNNVGIVLSGGGARGFAHLGIIKALEEKGIKPDIISGVSAGALVGAFLASGKPVDESYEILNKYSFFRSVLISVSEKRNFFTRKNKKFNRRRNTIHFIGGASYPIDCNHHEFTKMEK